MRLSIKEKQAKWYIYRDGMERKITPIDELPEFVKGEIYLVKNKKNGKVYVGQTRTHILNHGKFRPFGSHKRWVQHVSEAIGNYAHQSMKLNHSIRKHGSDSFEVEILETCEVKDLNYWETYYVNLYNSIEEGYNLTGGGDRKELTEEGKIKVANKLIEYYKDKKKQKFKDMQVEKIYISWTNYTDMKVANLCATCKQVDNTIKQIKVDFGGKKCPFDESVKRAMNFALELTSKDKITIHGCLEKYLI